MKFKEINDKSLLTYELLKDVMFFKIAEGGAMGEPGGVIFIKANGESYRLNYCLGKIKIGDLILAFEPLRKSCFGIFSMGVSVPKGWDYINLGMGNHLLVNESIINEFKEATAHIKRAADMYSAWYKIALNIINEKRKEKLTMENKLTELIFILDRSGSMAGMEADTIGGFNATIEKQKKLAGDVVVSTVLFSTSNKVLHDRVDINKIEPMNEEQYQVGGGTALLDAIGGAIHHIGNVHKYAREEDRPAHTMFIITTDGMENASRMYGSDRIKQMIRRQEEKYGWEFLFVAANIDAVETAEHIGIRRERAANYNYSKKGTRNLYEAVSYAVTAMRKCEESDEKWKDELNKD